MITERMTPLARNPIPAPVPIHRPPGRAAQRQRAAVVGHGKPGEESHVRDELVPAHDKAEAAQREQHRGAGTLAVKLASGTPVKASR